MGKFIAVERPSRATRVPVPRGRPMTPITGKRYISTFIAPVSDPGGRSRREMWGARSKCGAWRYDRQDDGIGTLWTVTYVPTGQTREGYGNLNAARRDTAAGLLAELRSEAFVAGLLGHTAQGHRWLAVHMRVAGADEAEARCVCGGLLVRATRDGKWGHVDGCDLCYRHGEGLDATCIRRKAHKFCGWPVPVECVHHLDRPRACGEIAAPNGGRGCGRGQSGDCCTLCCNGE
jgi:hypothetical protein